MSRLIPLLCGVLFGLGLAVSNMLNPSRVVGFLDVFGAWDPTLAFVMSGALLITIPGFAWVLRRNKPLFAKQFELPTKQVVDPALVTGAVLFGIGWGLSGLCPGPALAALVSLRLDFLLFVAVMLISWWLTDTLLNARQA